jgi:hypothetical protein
VSPEEVVRRAQRARAIVEDELYAEAWSAARDSLVKQMLAAPQTDVDKVMGAKAVLAGLEIARAYLERLMADGQVAAQDIEIAEKQRRGLL